MGRRGKEQTNSGAMLKVKGQAIRFADGVALEYERSPGGSGASSAFALGTYNGGTVITELGKLWGAGLLGEGQVPECVVA